MDLRNPWALKEPTWNLHRDLGPGLVGPRSRRAARLDGFFTRSVTGGGLSLIGGVGGVGPVVQLANHLPLRWPVPTLDYHPRWLH